jgi:N6-L-threonylcarbamoyladenine synthase
MIILGIETSCDDTGVAIIKTPNKKGGKFKILSNIVSSQIKVHQKYGGVVPNLAAREHLKNIEPCLRQALKEGAKRMKKDLKGFIREIDLIAVTIGPGLIPSLLIGVHFAKTLAYKWKKPIVGVNHLEGHILSAISNFKFQILNQFQMTKFQNLFPAVALVVSGGHTQLVLMKNIGNYKILGETRDDAAGECFDKVAKLLRLGYPGGPAIAAQAAKFQISKSKFQTNSKFQISKLPRPMINQKNYDFSFSGLKTAVLYKVKNVGNRVSNISALCHEVQQAIIDVLIEKTLRAAKEYKAKTIILSGGVAANEQLREQFKFKIKNLKFKIEFLTPLKTLCTDNAAMIAMAGYFNKSKKNIKANANLRIG